MIFFNCGHYVFLLEYSSVRSVKTQLIYCLITSVTTCFDSHSHHPVNLEPYQFRYINPYPTAFPYGNGMVLHFYQQQESSTTKTVHKVINKGLKTYV